MAIIAVALLIPSIYLSPSSNNIPRHYLILYFQLYKEPDSNEKDPKPLHQEYIYHEHFLSQASFRLLFRYY